jgi:hypothetical protein
MPKAKDILKGVGLAAAALAGMQALRNDKFRRDFRKIGEEELEPLRKAVRKENARENVPTFSKARMVDVLPKLSEKEIAENFLTDSKGNPVTSGTGDVVRRGTTAFKKGGAVKKEVWEKPRPKSLGKSTPLAPKKKAAAKAAAKKAGRPYPNLVDNMRAARKK